MSEPLAFETIAHLVPRVKLRGDATALMAFRDERCDEWSCAYLADTALRLAARLKRDGVNHQEPILLFAPNSPEWIATYLSAICAGAVIVPIDHQASEGEIEQVLRVMPCRWAFTTQENVGWLLRAKGPRPANIVLIDPSPNDSGFTHWTDMLDREPIADLLAKKNDIASVLFTSGTTGRPKAVPLTHENFMNNLSALTEASLAHQGDRVLLPLPLHHAYAFMVGMLASLATGATLVLPAGTTGPEIVDALARGRVTILIGVPRLYRALMIGLENRVKERGRWPHRLFKALLQFSLIVRRTLGLRLGRFIFARVHHQLAPELRTVASGGAKLDAELARKMEALGWQVFIGYGLTETSPILTYNLRHHCHIGSVGRPIKGIDIKIDAPGPEGDGEILARGTSVFSGYRNNPQANKNAFTSAGWFRTGDIGHLDRRGYLHILSRVKDIVVLPGGENVLLEDVEEHFDASSFVIESGVIEADGKLTALIRPDHEEIRKYGAARADTLVREEVALLNRRLPSYKRISGYRLVHDALPRTRLGKLQRFLLPGVMASIQSATAAAPAKAPQPLDSILQSGPEKEVFEWLQGRYPESPLTLETSPQLDLGIDSLDWTSLTLDLQHQFDVLITEDALARIITVRDLLNETKAAREKKLHLARSNAPSEALPPKDEVWLRPRGPLYGFLGLLLWLLNWSVFHALVPVRVTGADRVSWDKGVVLAPNHVSYLDAFALASTLSWARLRRVSWAGWTGLLFSGPFRRLFSRAASVLPIDPNRRPANALTLGHAALEKGRVLIWFPEGRRSPDGEIGPLRDGIGLLLEKSRSPVVPVFIDGTFKAWPVGKTLPRLAPIRVSFGTPLSVDDLDACGTGKTPAERITASLRQHLVELKRSARQ